MNSCPNFNDARYRHLENTMGELEAYKYWHRNNGDLSGVDLTKEYIGNSVNAVMKVVKALKDPKLQQKFAKFFTNDKATFFQRLNDYAPKNEVDALREWTKENNPKTIDDLITGVLADMSYTIQITNGKTSRESFAEVMNRGENPWEVETLDSLQQSGTHYSNLTVPGGTNYTENEIATPGIKPSIKGHAAFSTDNGIGWFRSDDKQLEEIQKNYYQRYLDLGLNNGRFSDYEDVTNTPEFQNWYRNQIVEDENKFKSQKKTRRILEVQSDLFQKGRDKEDLIGVRTKEGDLLPEMYYDSLQEHGIDIDNSKDPSNQFLQVLNKDNNWVTLFVKSIVQDSQRKGYENVRFPAGDTAAKVEGHESIDEFIKGRQDYIDSSEAKIAELRSSTAFWDDGYGYKYFIKDGEYFKSITGDPIPPSTPDRIEKVHQDEFETTRTMNIETIQNTVDEFKKEIRQARTGTLKISSVAGFYENTIHNILNKQYGKDNIKEVTDEYGNKWFELALKPEHANTIYFAKPSIPATEGGVIGKLQSEGTLGKRVDVRTYVVNPLENDQAAYEYEKTLKAKLGEESVRMLKTPSGFAIEFDPKMFEIVSKLDPEDRQVYNNFLIENLYGTDPNPTTTTLLMNSALMAKDLGREDLVDMSRLIFKYLSKNPTLRTYMSDNTNGNFGKNTKAYYESFSNVIAWNKDAIGVATLEQEVETVLEEHLHALTVQPLHKFTEGKTLSDNEKQFVATVYKYYNYFRTRENAQTKDYRFKNAEEFLIGALIDTSFRDHLKQLVNDDKAKENFFVSFMKNIVKAMLKLFGFRVEDNVVDELPIESFEKGLFKSLSDYLQNANQINVSSGLKEDGRDYGLSFATTADRDWQAEKNKLRTSFAEKNREEMHKMINKAMLGISSFSASIRGKLPESDNTFRNLRDQLKKVEDADYGKDIVDFFSDFVLDIAALHNIVEDKITALRNDQSIVDPDTKLKEYDKLISAIRNFDPILDEVLEVSIDLEQLGIQGVTSAVNGMSATRRKIQAIYDKGTFPLVTGQLTNILSEASLNAINIEQARIDVMKQKLIDAGGETTHRGVGISNQIKRAQNDIDKVLTLNNDKISNWLRGEVGDTNVISVWLMAAVSSADPIVAGLAKYIRDHVGLIAPEVNNLHNELQSQIEDYQKGTERNINNIAEFNSPMIQKYKVIKGVNDKGEYEEVDEYALLHEFTGEHITQLQRFTRDLGKLNERKRQLDSSNDPDEAELTLLTSEIKRIREERQKFMRDYMELQYSPEVHEAKDLLYKPMEDEFGTFTAWDYMGGVIHEIEDTEEAINQANDPEILDGLWDKLHDLNFELKRLSSLYEKTSGSREFRVAEVLKERSKKLAEFSDFILTNKGLQNFEAEKARQNRYLATGEISQEDYDRWLDENTVTELTKEYWNKKRAMLDKISNLLNLMDIKNEKNEDIKKLYGDIEDIVKAHRDSNGIINGLNMSDQELIDVKAIEEDIEKAKDAITSISGITRAESIRLAQLYGQLEEINEKEVVTDDDNVLMQLAEQGDMIRDEIDKIKMKKRKVDETILKKYFAALEVLSLLDKSSNTIYYQQALDEKMAVAKAKVDITNIPKKFFYNGNTYVKGGNSWIEDGEGGQSIRDQEYVNIKYQEMKSEITLKASDWWKNNHIIKNVWVRNDDYDVYDTSSSHGSWQQVEMPTYAWRQTRPSDSRYLSEGQPSFKYRTRIFKDQYKNPNYREDVSGSIRPKLVGAKDDRYINKDYFKLANSTDPKDKATFKMLTFLTNTYMKAQESIGSREKRPGYKLPSIRKSDVERLLSKSLKETGQNLFEKIGQIAKIFTDKLLPNEQDKDIIKGYTDDNNGMVPVRYVGQIDAEDQSLELARIIQMFTIEAMKREALIKTLPLANAIKNIVNDKKNMPLKTTKGAIQSFKRKFSPKGVESGVTASSSNRALQINELIRSEYNGEQMKDVPGAKLVSNVLGYGSKLLLGLNFVSSIQNYANAYTQSVMETESKIGGNFTIKDYAKAQKIYWAHVHEMMADIGKYGNKSYTNQLFDYFGGINFKVFTKDNKSLSHASVREYTASLGVPNQITEHMLNYQMGIAIALNYRVKSGDTMIPVYDAFTLINGKLKVKDGVEVTKDDRLRMISRLNSSARRINGEYGDKVLADKYVLGRLAFFMNRYLVPFVVKRYGARKFDIQDGIREEGYWRLLGKLIFRDIKARSVPLTVGWKYYTPAEKTAILKATTEFGFTVMFFLMINALGGGDDKHLGNNSVLANDLIYALKGIQQQNEAFMPVPGVGFDDLFRKAQNPFPILGKIKNLISLIQDGSHTIYYEMGLPGVDQSDVYYTKKTGWHQPGDFKAMSDLQKLTGIWYRILQYTHPDQAVKNLDVMSRIK